MQGPMGNGSIQVLDVYEQMVNTFSEQAKTYWRMWGPPGEPMVNGIDAWAEMQRAYLAYFRQTMDRRP